MVFLHVINENYDEKGKAATALIMMLLFMHNIINFTNTLMEYDCSE